MTATLKAVRLYRIDATHRTTWLVVEVLTEEGYVGVGECSDSTSVDDVPAEVGLAFDLLAGVELTADLEALEQLLWRWAAKAAEPSVRFMRGTVVGGMVAAVCDIVAQVNGMPLWKWLGGEARATVPLYANINRSARRRDPHEFAQLAAGAAADGFSRVKLAPFDGPPLPGRSLVQTGIKHVAAVRDAVGDDAQVLVDVHHRLSRHELGEILRPLEDLGVGWLEDAVDVHMAEDLAWLAGATSIPLAGGERIVDPEVVSTVLAGGHLSVLLLDPKYVGGPLRLKRLLERVEHAALTYHNPTGPVGTAAASHLSTLHPDFALLEYAYGEEVDRAGMTEPAENVEGGEISLRNEPGLGVRLHHEGLGPESMTWEWVA